MTSWADNHRLIWPGYELPELLTPLASKKRPRDPQATSQAWFNEMTVPTSLFISVLAAGVSNPMRNRMYRSRSACVVVDLVRLCCKTGKLRITTRPLGNNPDAQAISWPVPSGGCLPLACFVSSAAGAREFMNAWTWDAKDEGFRDSFKQSVLP